MFRITLLAAVVALGGLHAAVAAPMPPRAQEPPNWRPGDPVAAFYHDRAFETFWLQDREARLEPFLKALDDAWMHGLPIGRYDSRALRQQLRAATEPADLARVDVAITRAFFAFVQDARSGAVQPKRVDPTIVRDVYRRSPQAEMANFAHDPAGYLATLFPADPAYGRLVAQRVELATADWGDPVPMAVTLHPGEGGPAVAALHARLAAMGYAPDGAGYDEALRRGVRAFQADHGLAADGIAGPATLAEINVPAEIRAQQVIVAMERLRWMHGSRGDRYVWVDLTEQMIRLVDHGQTVFETRGVIGKPDPTYRTPEFSDRMDYIVINPAWHVPGSIATAEYLPKLQKDPYAAPQLQVVDATGTVIDRRFIDFRAYTAQTFPYRLRQPPSDDNALGMAKFMFPNPWNIYLHDTPARHLFGQSDRAFSHGCVRVSDPSTLAEVLIGPQSDDPAARIKAAVDSGKETVITLRDPPQVHLVYFTAYPAEDGHIRYRPDIYGRDAAIWDAMARAGVALRGEDG
ncbi:L,D-transpeptidase family protein [Falsirhodobacter algicola]|uniref:L,D-transpeptidase family protein n=1 Tax=Falsirhodobacter algicola TaxID=2692330 RepID=A0A8J8MS23_9RHOB|nr:L,D-transpeptidase family protein [Falsirhodobacter algicola]QUS35422.1 L,D-transpeptidase family protein [Falsirhodobacter algicola]